MTQMLSVHRLLRYHRRLRRLYWAMALVTSFLLVRAVWRQELRLLCQFAPMLVLLLVTASQQHRSFLSAADIVSTTATLVICVCIVLCAVDQKREKSWATGAEVAILLQDLREVWDHSDTSLKHRPLRKGLLWFWLLWIIGGGLIGLAAFFVDLEKWVDQWTVTSVLVERFSHHALREDVAGLDIPIRRHTTSRF